MGKLNFPQLKVGEGAIPLRIISEPYLVLTMKGYTPVVDVFHLRQRVNYTLYIQAKSIGEGLEPLREANDGGFKGIEFLVRKETGDKFSPYIIELII